MIEYTILSLSLVLVYAWIGYPVLLLLACSFKKTPATCNVPPATGNGVASVSIIVAAHNEEAVISQRIENLLSVSKVANVKFEIFIGSDASTDGTVAKALEFEASHDNVHVFEYKERRGKVAVLKSLVDEAKKRGEKPEDRREGADGERAEDGGQKTEDRGQGENVDHRERGFLTEGNEGNEEKRILVFTDANTEFEAGALEKMLRPFDDPEVGGVCGRLVFRENKRDKRQETRDTTRTWEGRGGIRAKREVPKARADGKLRVKGEEEFSRRGTREPELSHGSGQAPGAENNENRESPEGVYWRLENWLKQRESSLDSCLGANGAIYAIKADCFYGDIPDNTIVDDFVVGMKVREQGKRMLYEPEAIAYEEFPDTAHEWGRRVRIGAGDYQALVLCRQSLLPKYGKFAWSFISHKVLRWLTPHMIIALFALSFFSTGRQAGFYVFQGLGVMFFFAILGRIMKDSRVPLAKLFRLCDHFVTMQVALFVGFVDFCKGDLRGMWNRTPRGS